MTGTLEQILKSFVKIGKPNECWMWTGSLRTSGYGQIHYQGRPRSAHRVIAHLVLGCPLDGTHFDVMHTCDNRPCCNWNHFKIGTRKDNMQDASRKGRLKKVG